MHVACGKSVGIPRAVQDLETWIKSSFRESIKKHPLLEESISQSKSPTASYTEPYTAPYTTHHHTVERIVVPPHHWKSPSGPEDQGRQVD